MKRGWISAIILFSASSAAHAAPGLDDAVYGASIEADKTEIETRYGRLTGGNADGEDAFVLEAAHGFSSRFYGAALAAFEHSPGNRRRLGALALEGIFAIGKIKSLGLETAVYVEAEHSLHGPDKFETKLLLEHRQGRFNSRLNLIAERALTSGAPVEFSYAASADFEVGGDVRLGAEALGDLGNSRSFTARGEHFVGPVVKAELDQAGPGELELRAGYLLAVDRSRDETKGQLRLGLEYEF